MTESEPKPGTRSKRHKRCYVCKRTREELGHISLRGLCIDCAVMRATEAARQMQAKKGPAWTRYRKAMAETFAPPAASSH